MLPTTDRWLRTTQAAKHAGYGGPSGFVTWAAKVGLGCIKRGRILLWDRLDIDAKLDALKGYPYSAKGYICTRPSGRVAPTPLNGSATARAGTSAGASDVPRRRS